MDAKTRTLQRLKRARADEPARTGDENDAIGH